MEELLRGSNWLQRGETLILLFRHLLIQDRFSDFHDFRTVMILMRLYCSAVALHSDSRLSGAREERVIQLKDPQLFCWHAVCLCDLLLCVTLYPVCVLISSMTEYNYYKIIFPLTCSWFQSFTGTTAASWKTRWVWIWAGSRMEA